jgi:AcrR family transcriptional regulator
MPLARFERLEPERRRRILAAAAQEFAAKGYEDASLGGIADESGFSKPALYYYFEDKADLYATVVRESWKRLSPPTPVDLQNLTADSFWPALAAHHLGTFEHTRQEPWLAAVWKLAYHPPREGPGAGAVAEVFDAAREFLKALLRRGQELGLVRNDFPEDFLIAVLTGADQAADHWLVDHWDSLGLDEVHRLSRQVFETLQLILAPPGRREA